MKYEVWVSQSNPSIFAVGKGVHPKGEQSRECTWHIEHPQTSLKSPRPTHTCVCLGKSAQCRVAPSGTIRRQRRDPTAATLVEASTPLPHSLRAPNDHHEGRGCVSSACLWCEQVSIVSTQTWFDPQYVRHMHTCQEHCAPVPNQSPQLLYTFGNQLRLMCLEWKYWRQCETKKITRDPEGPRSTRRPSS